MSLLSDYFDHASERIGYHGSKPLPEYDTEDMSYTEACPTLLPYLYHSMNPIHIAMAQISVDLQLVDYPPTDDGLEQTSNAVEKRMVPQMLDALATAACVGSGAAKILNAPTDRDEFVAEWQRFFGDQTSQAHIGLIRQVYSTDEELMDKINHSLASAAKTVQVNELKDHDDALDIWHHAAHLASVACYLVGFEMGKAMDFESSINGLVP